MAGSSAGNHLRWWLLLPLLAVACGLFGGGEGADLPPASQTATAVWAVPGCHLRQMTARLTAASGNLSEGEIIIENTTNQPCRLHGLPLIELSDSGGQVLDVEMDSVGGDPASAFVLLPGQSAAARFTWRNYCGLEPLGGLFMDVSVPEYNGEATILLEDANGMPLNTTPACDNSEALSRMEATSLQPQP